MPDIIANWPAPANISALTTTRATGNLALHVGDNLELVELNRVNLAKRLSLPNQPEWLNQTHTNQCVVVENELQRNADASITRSTQHPLVIMTADCLPILLCDRAGTEIAAIHAGWRGLLHGIVENTINKMHTSRERLIAWVGPAICHRCYETGQEVRDAYTSRYSFANKAFHNHATGIHANLPLLAELILQASGVTAVYQSKACTFESEQTLYSYRRNAQTGRIATLIWFNKG